MKTKAVSIFRSCFLFVAGLMLAASAAQAQAAEPGSVVLFSQYASSPTNAVCNDTLFTLTNSHPTQNAFVRVLFINRADLKVEEYSVCLPAKESLSWRAGEMDPGINGFAFAVATDAEGRPVNFNYLSGASSRVSKSGKEPWQDAVSLAKLTKGAVLPTKGVSAARFDGAMYAWLPEQFAALLPAAVLRVAADPIACSAGFTYIRRTAVPIE